MRCVAVRAIKGISARLPTLAPVVWSVPQRRDSVAITFDDGPTQFTPGVLESLAQHGAKATFFVLCNQVEQQPDVLRRISAGGHEIGIHGWHHSVQDYYHQVLKCEAILAGYGVEPKIVRTPKCIIKPLLALRLWLRGYPTIIHNLDVHDSMRCEGKWSGPPPDYTTIRGGDIILMHDDNEVCVKDLLLILETIRHKGLATVTVSELLTRHPTRPDSPD